MRRDASDWTVSIDELQALCPNLEWVTLVVAWFGDDLRAGSCTIRPKVDDATKVTSGATWQVAGLTRATAERGEPGRRAGGLWRHAERPFRGARDPGSEGARAEGGARAVRADGHPGGERAAQPGDGRHRAAGISLARAHHLHAGAGPARARPTRPLRRRPRSRRSSARRTRAIFPRGQAGRPMLGRRSGATGAWSCTMRISPEMAGGVDAFLIGSELRRADDAALGDERLSVRGGAQGARGRRAFGAGRRDGDFLCGGLERVFRAPAGRRHRATCTSTSIRCGPTTRSISSASTSTTRSPTGATSRGMLDETSGRSPYDSRLSPLEHARRRGLRLVLCERGGPRGAGPHADHRRRCTASRGCSASRTSRPGGRTRITTGRAASRRRRRPAGCRRAKPIWLTELGCPAVDKGANQPNVFFDPKSAQSALPYFSERRPRRFPAARLCRGVPALLRHRSSGVRRIEPGLVGLWRADDRRRRTCISGRGTRGRYPYFPDLADVWSDGANWERGHWLNGRLGR